MQKNTFKKIPTPDDFFCSGHAQLPDGRLLVAGGTARYELLDGEVERAGGGMRVKNESPDKAVFLKKGTRFRSPAGVEYVTKFDVTVPKAKRTFISAVTRGGRTYILSEMHGLDHSWRPQAAMYDWAFRYGDQARPVGRLVEPGEVTEPPTLPPATDPARPAQDAPSDSATREQEGVAAAIPAGLQDGDGDALLGQQQRGGHPGHTAADHRDVDLEVLGQRRMLRGGRRVGPDGGRHCEF